MAKENLNLVFYNGLPSAGKDRQATFLEEAFPHSSRVSPGDIMRGAVEGSGGYAAYRELIAPYEDLLKQGKLVPNKVVGQLVKREILARVDQRKRSLIFTGFPRNAGQLEVVDQMVDDLRNRFDINEWFIYLEISGETSQQRTARRLLSRPARGMQARPDDQPEVLKTRLQVFTESTLPMLMQLRKEGRLSTVNAEEPIHRVREVALWVIKN